MDIVLDNYIKNIDIEQLMNFPVGEKLRQAVRTLETVQECFYGLTEKQNELGMTEIKIITVLSFATLKKIAEGKKVSELNNDDWKNIALAVSEYAVIADDQMYSVFIFNMYERCIRSSAKQIKSVVSTDVSDAINQLADDLHTKLDMLVTGKITEAVYIEECLWICLEAMIKLIASTVFLLGNKEIFEFIQAISTIAFEYGRMVLYKKEQEIITEYLVGQYQLDKELDEKFTDFLKELQDQAHQFSALIDNAFMPNFKDAYLNSIRLAISAGVPETEILKSSDDIDDFFLN